MEQLLKYLDHIMLAVSLFAYTGVIVWGFAKVAKILDSKNIGSTSALINMMSTMTTNADGEQNLDLSYAKVSGAILSLIHI